MQLHGKLPSGLPRETVNNLFQLYYPKKKKGGKHFIRLFSAMAPSFSLAFASNCMQGAKRDSSYSSLLECFLLRVTFFSILLFFQFELMNAERLCCAGPFYFVLV